MGLKHCLNPGCIDYQCTRDEPKCPGEVCASCDYTWSDQHAEDGDA